MDTTKLGEGRERGDDLGRLAGGHAERGRSFGKDGGRLAEVAGGHAEHADLGHGDGPAEIVAPDAGRGFALEGLGGRAGEGGEIQLQLKIVSSYLGGLREELLADRGIAPGGVEIAQFVEYFAADFAFGLFEAFIELFDGFVPDLQANVDSTERRAHFGFAGRVVAEIARDSSGGGVEEIADGGFAALDGAGGKHGGGLELGKLSGSLGFAIGEVGLTDGDDGGGQERTDGEGGSGYGNFVATGETGGAILDGLWPGHNWLAVQVAGEVFTEIVDGGVAVFGFGSESFVEDDGEVGVALAGGEGVDVLGGPAPGIDHGGGVAEGPAAGDEFVEDDAEGKDVAGGGDALIAQWLRACVARGSQDHGSGRVPGVDGFSDAEIEEFGGLDIAMDDEVAMGVGDGSADFAKQAEAGTEIEIALGPVFEEVFAGDELHNNVEGRVMLRWFRPARIWRSSRNRCSSAS